MKKALKFQTIWNYTLYCYALLNLAINLLNCNLLVFLDYFYSIFNNALCKSFYRAFLLENFFKNLVKLKKHEFSFS